MNATATAGGYAAGPQQAASPKRARAQKGPKQGAGKEAAGKASKGRSILSGIRYGESVSLDSFRRNAWLLIPLIAVILALMGLRYKTKAKMQEIRTLTVELHKSESSKLQEKAQYMSLIRETEMLRMVEERELGLVFREEPPVTVPLVE